MSLAGILIAILNCVVLALILVIVGAIVQWVLSALGWGIPQNIQKLFLALVALIFLICVISALLGAPMFHLIHVSKIGMMMLYG